MLHYVMWICVGHVTPIYSIQDTCEDIINSGKSHVEIIKHWKEVTSTHQSQTINHLDNFCQSFRSCSYSNEVFLSLKSVDQQVGTDYHFSSPISDRSDFTDNFTGFGTLQFLDSSIVCIRGTCRDAILYANTNQSKYLRAPIIAIKGNFCQGVLQGNSEIIFSTGSLVEANFGSGVVEGLTREFRGGELVGVANYKGGVVWRIEGRRESQNGAFSQLKRHSDYFVTDGTTGTFVIVEKEVVEVFTGLDHGGDVHKVKRSDIVGWECRESLPFPRTKVRNDSVELDVLIEGVEDADLLLYQVTKLKIRLKQSQELKSKVRNPLQRFPSIGSTLERRSSFPLTGLVSFPGSGNTWIRLLLVHATNLPTGDEMGSLKYIAGSAITTRSHHFPQQPKFHVGPLYRQHQTFYEDVIQVCHQGNHTFIHQMSVCASIIQPDKVLTDNF